jgi:WD40 repeat protein
LWDLRSAKCVRLLPGHARGVSKVVISPDGSAMATGTHGGNVHIWDLGTAEMLSVWPAHAASVHGLAISRAGQLIASGGGDCCMALWQPSRCVISAGFILNERSSAV